MFANLQNDDRTLFAQKYKVTEPNQPKGTAKLPLQFPPRPTQDHDCNKVFRSALDLVSFVLR